ncbi:transglycosylase domain-containing protein [Dongia deserti]|uniref:transglycosylase domain-containing protein n=1 Tax=Dongia deserti TaxID=2268030 RepID=UPI000E647A41|nr:PBP1A family penicillin-binding protein [Dongia deserti]
MVKPESHKPEPRRSWRRAALWFLAKWSMVGAIWTGFFALLFLAWCAYDLPGPERLNDLKRQRSVSLLAADGSLIASYGDLYGDSVRLTNLPPYLPAAVLATEDRRFYSHWGVDLRGVARALYINVREGEMVQGGSTITQQVAKNLFLTPERSLHRKGQEMLLALWLERTFTKDEILELYLNRVYFGAGTYGVDAAAKKYFGRSARDVTIYQAAMLAGLLKAPSRFNPFNDKALAKSRAELVIRNMVAAGQLTEAEANAISKSAAPSMVAQGKGQIGQHFADWVIDQVSSYVGYADQDLVVQTTLDPALQHQAEQTLVRVLTEHGAAVEASQGALVSMRPDGAVVAMVGGTDYRSSQFNRATQALRQPGSAFKTFVYLAAFENGYVPGNLFVDGPIRIGKWSPGNYEDKYYGQVTLREAFARSLNSVAVQLSERVGRGKVIDIAHRLGITEPMDNTAAIALGVSETTLLEMTGAYATFANVGNGVWPFGIDRIAARDGTVLYERQGSGPGPVASPASVRKMLDVMAATVESGTARKAKLDRPVYGKTGTSQNFRDAWFVGLTHDLVTGVWIGNDDNAPMDKVTGGTLPVTIWHDFMAPALANTPIADVRRPGGDVIAATDLNAQGGSDRSWLTELLTGAGGTTSKATPAKAEKSQVDNVREKVGLPARGNNK